MKALLGRIWRGNNMSENGITIQEFLQIYQTLNGRFDTLLTTISMFATVFGIIITIVLAFFVLRQINVDREIRQYRNEIKKQKEAAIYEVKNIKSELEKASILLSEAKKVKNQIEKEFKKPQNKDTEQKIIKLEEKINKFEEEISYKRGALSAFPEARVAGTKGFYDLGLNDLYFDGVAYSPFQERCKNCGRGYNNSVETINYYHALAGEDINKSKCPYCGNIN